ncbi:MAG: hypothetical protein RLZZ261_1183 [Bacteroidota bacterium]|jgi:hypothetical protein
MVRCLTGLLKHLLHVRHGNEIGFSSFVSGSFYRIPVPFSTMNFLHT